MACQRRQPGQGQDTISAAFRLRSKAVQDRPLHRPAPPQTLSGRQGTGGKGPVVPLSFEPVLCSPSSAACYHTQVKAVAGSLSRSMSTGMHMRLHICICIGVHTPEHRQKSVWASGPLTGPLEMGSLRCMSPTGSEVMKGFSWPFTGV